MNQYRENIKDIKGSTWTIDHFTDKTVTSSYTLRNRIHVLAKSTDPLKTSHDKRNNKVRSKPNLANAEMLIVWVFEFPKLVLFVGRITF